VRSIQPARLEKTIDQAREIETDLVILDTAPHTESSALAAARASDLVIIPCQPKIMDLRAMRRTADLIRLVKAPAFVVLNGVPHQGSVSEEAAESIRGDIGLAVAPVRLGSRVAYDRALISGQTAQEFEPGGKAAREVEALYMWACQQVNMLTQKEGSDEQPVLARA
jgi:chromosome partitioning protein